MTFISIQVFTVVITMVNDDTADKHLGDMIAKFSFSQRIAAH